MIEAGAYGVRIASRLPLDRLALTGAAAWPLIQVSIEPDPRPRAGEHSYRRTEGSVCVAADGSRARLPRAAGVALAELVHPALATAGWLAARARGEAVLHAGAFDTGDGAWLMPAGKESGKSTLLALLAARGVDVVADDMSVLRGMNVCAAPRCIDLRPDAAARSGVGEPVRGGERRRIPLAPTRAEHALRGFIHLEWADRIELVPLAPGERLARILRHADALPRERPSLAIELAALPHYELRRPRTWEDADAVADMLLDRLAPAAAVAA